MPKPARQLPTTKARTQTSSAGNGKLSIFDRIAPIGFDPEDGIKLLLYGRSGTGKTTTWATFPKPILAMIVSGGDKPGELRSIDTDEYREDIRQVVIQDSSEVHEFVSQPERWPQPYQTIVLDHASGLQDKVLAEIMKVDQLPAQKSWGFTSRENYGACVAQCKELFRAMLSLQCNVVIVAQERASNSEGESELLTPSVGAGLMPSLVSWLNPACDYIGQTFIRPKMKRVTKEFGQGKTKKTQTMEVKTKAKEYCLRTAPDEVYTTKFRVPKGRPLPDVIVGPTYTKIMAIIRGEEIGDDE